MPVAGAADDACEEVGAGAAVGVVQATMSASATLTSTNNMVRFIFLESPCSILGKAVNRECLRLFFWYILIAISHITSSLSQS
jgi:hypothetical protein